MKPEYSDQTKNMDILIIGGMYGEGKRRSNMLSHFLCAVADPKLMKATTVKIGDAPEQEVMC